MCILDLRFILPETVELSHPRQGLVLHLFNGFVVVVWTRLGCGLMTQWNEKLETERYSGDLSKKKNISGLLRREGCSVAYTRWALLSTWRRRCLVNLSLTSDCETYPIVGQKLLMGSGEATFEHQAEG